MSFKIKKKSIEELDSSEETCDNEKLYSKKCGNNKKLLEIEEDNRIGQDNAEIMNRLQLTLKPSSRLLNRVSSSSKPRTTGGKGKSLNKKRRNHKKTNRNKKNKMKRTRRLRQ